VSNVTPLRTRKPTGKPGWPRILVSGEQGAWKSGTAAMLSADERLGEMFWLEVGDGETTADEYGALPGVRYTIIDHDGTWLDIYNQLAAAWDVAKAAEEAGEPPIPLTIDAMSGIWSMLMDLGDTRARRKAAKQLADQRRDAEVAWSADYDATMTADLWGLVKKRHGQLMGKILTWPGPVVLISRERMATVFENGNPTSRKDWSLECKKDLPSQVTAWVRTEGGGIAQILKLRSARAAVSVELSERARRVSDFSLSKLIFDWVGCEVGVSRAAHVVHLDADQDMPDEVTRFERPQAQQRQDERTQRARQAAREAPLSRAERQAKAVEYLLTAADVDQAGHREAWAKQQAIRGDDISGLLDERDRDELSYAKGQPVTLERLATDMAVYVGSNKRALRPAAEQAADAGDEARAIA
jgi:hypothetical protein